MMLLIRTIASLHLIVYLAIMWYGWQSYKTLRKESWRYIGIGFTIFLIYRIRQLIKQLMVDYPLDAESTLIPFIGSLFLLAGFWLMSGETREFIRLMSDPSPARAGAQSVEFWLKEFRLIVREEIAAASGTTTVTVKGPAALTDPIKEK